MNLFKALFGGKEEKPDEKVKAEEEKNFDILKYDGVRAMRSGRNDYAIKCFTHALQMKEDLEIRDYVSQACIRADMMSEAYGHLQKIAEAQPENQQVYVRMANVAYMLEDYSAMADACVKAEELDADNAEVVYLHAKACIGKEDTDGAVELLARAITLKPDFGEAYLLRGETLLAKGDVEGAGSDADHLLDANTDNEDVLMLKARVEKAKGNADDALMYYNKVVDANPFNGNAYKERGEIRLAAGDVEGGKDDMDYAAELLDEQNATRNDEDIERKVKDAYSNINPMGI